MNTTLQKLEQTVTRMTGKTPAQIRQAPLPRLTGSTPPGFVASTEINRSLDKDSQWKDLAAIIGFLAVVAVIGLILKAVTG